MRPLNKIIFVFFVSIGFFSCSKKNVGFFNNNYQRYEAHKVQPSSSKAQNVQANAAVNNSKSEITNAFEQVSTDKSGVNQYPVNSVLNNNASDEPVQKRKLTKDEKKAIKKDIRQVLKSSKSNESGLGTVVLVILAIILPPLAVALVDGITGPFWLSILLTILFYLPGLIYALYRIFNR